MLTGLLDIYVRSVLASQIMDQERKAENRVKSDTKPKDLELLAKLVIREGKDFKSSAIQAGYAPSVAARGMKALLDRSHAATDIFARESNNLLTGVDRLKPLAIARLHTEISDLRRPGGLKAIEIAGRLKELDWFVRNVDVQVGIFQSFADASPDPAAESLDTYKSEE